MEESIATNDEIDERFLRHELRVLKLWKMKGNSLKFTSKLSKLLPQCGKLLEKNNFILGKF